MTIDWRRFVILALAVAPACEKGPETTEPTAATAPADEHPCDSAATVLLGTLQHGEFESLAEHTSDPLTHDLSRTEFEDLAAIVQWLGPLQSREVENTDDTFGGGQRWYALRFDKGSPVELEVSIAPSGKLVGFEFSGKGYAEAERGVLAEPWREFKVYDFHFLGDEGNRLPPGEPITGRRVDYEIVVGGIEAMLGAHHLSVEKLVLDGSGNTVFAEPIEFDTKFEEDAMGVPRGTVRGYVEVPGAGSWKMELRITDENAHRDIEYEQEFETK
ncbi:MAG: hypothetical protein ACE37F_02045 [Nannocystaceae bacterium]|nr:hypothetical protein [bacterium]